jgi:uracil-xanthine permease
MFGVQCAGADVTEPSMNAVPETSYFPKWHVRTQGVIAPDERLPAPQTLALGLQHVVAMFGSTVLAPLLMGFSPNVAILFSGIGTLIFFVVVGGRVPSYLGSSFAFIAVVIAATGYAGSGPNANLGVALSGIIAAGVVYAVIGLIVMAIGYHWIDRLMPPVVTGSVVAVIGLNLAPIAVKGISASALDTWIGLATIVMVGLIAVRAPGLARRLPILLGGIGGYLLHALCTNVLALGKPIDFSPVAGAAWIGLPALTAPVWNAQAIGLIAPVAVVLVAENLGHVKAVAAMTGRDLDPYLGRAFLGDAIATMVAGAGGGTGVTTYAENIGVMAVTKVYSTLLFVVAALFAIALGFSPKFGALISTIPGPVLGGLAIVVFGLITATGGRIWVQNRVDFSRARNLVTAAVALTFGAGDLGIRIGGFTLGGIGTATFGAIILYQLFREPDSETTFDGRSQERQGQEESRP